MRLFHCLSALLLYCFIANAQSLSVESFRLLENDLTANTYGTTEYDQNGQLTALLKIVTTEQGFVFEGGMLGIVNAYQKVGEIWVYVPYGLQRITIAHPEFGLLRDYYFPVSVQKGRTYELKLHTERAERNETDEIASVNVTFDNPMQNSGIYLNGILVGSGSWSGPIAASNFLLEVKQEGFITYSTTISLEPEDREMTIHIPALVPVTGNIVINSNPSKALVFKDGQRIGTTPMEIDEAAFGTYSFTLRLRGYKPFSDVVNVTRKEIYTIDASLKRINNFIYAGAGYQFGHISGVLASGGFSWHNVNAQVSYLFPNVESEKTYWVTSPETWDGTTTQVVYDFKPAMALRASVGYGLLLGRRFCLTPNAGAVFYTIEGTAGNEDKTSTTVISALGSVRLEYSPWSHLTFMVDPSYEIPFSYGSLAGTISDMTDWTDKWCGGFSVSAGISLNF